tara:strand:- start:168 stop:485 length:318 start_codon:yes stop_codon:yes gene_type:complete
MMKLKDLINEGLDEAAMNRSKSALRTTFRDMEERIGTKGKINFIGEIRDFFFDVVKHPKYIERAVKIIDKLEVDIKKGYSKASTDLDKLLDKAEAQAKKDAKKKK